MSVQGIAWVALRPALPLLVVRAAEEAGKRSSSVAFLSVHSSSGAVHHPRLLFHFYLPVFYVSNFSTDPLILSSISVVLKKSFPHGSRHAGLVMPEHPVRVLLITCFYWKPCFPVLPPHL